MSAPPQPVNVMVDGVNVFGWRVEGEGVPTVYAHGNPTNADQWLPFLRRGGPAVALDMPGWGRSSRPHPAEFDYSMHGLDATLHRAIEALGIEAHNLVVQDWGGLMLIGAQRQPDLIRRLVLIDSIALLPGYRWHWIARWFWRRRVLGELSGKVRSRPGLSLGLRQARGDRKAMPAWFVDQIFDHWDTGTNAAILALYRDADPGRLVEAGRHLELIAAPALVLWGERDPYLHPRFGEAYAERLPHAEFQLLPGLGHWPWIEDPSVIDRVLGFLG